MDPFEEFEFKPITEGLGFHNKKNTTPAPKRDQDFSFIEETITEKNQPSSAFLVKSPLPRESATDSNKFRMREEQSHNRTTETVDEILRTLNEKKKYDFKETSQSLRNETAPIQFKISYFELSAALLDMMLVTAGFLISMIVLLVVTKVDLISNLMNPDDGGEIYLGTIGLFAAITWIYLVVNRIFIGCTAGEWVFDQQVGKDQEIGSASYSLKIAFRSLLVIATGFITLPALSMIFGSDLTGKLTGTQIYKKV